MQSYDVFYKKGLIGAVPLKNVTSRFAMEKIKVGFTALAGARRRRGNHALVPLIARERVGVTRALSAEFDSRRVPFS